MTRTLIASLAAVIVALFASPAYAQRYTAPPKDVGNKLDAHLQDLTAGRGTGALTVSPGGRVLVDVYVTDLDAEVSLRAAGMSVQATASSPVPMVEGWVPTAALAKVARIAAVKGVVPVLPPLVQAWPGAKVSEGDAAHRAPAARAIGTGSGVAIGVMSDSINRVGQGVAGSQATGDLPTTVQVVADGAAGSTDEGRAMAEIIYDLAPGISKLVFATANGGAAMKAQRITAMANAGATVIADDTAYMLEPQFQDGVVSQAIDAVKARGVAYFASAGNQGRASWEGTFKPTNNGAAGANNFHDFGSGAVDQDQKITTVPPGGTVTVFVHWYEPYGAVTTDLDTYFVDPVGRTIITGDETDNLQNDLPFATMSVTNNGGTAAPVGFAMNRFAGTRTPFVKYIIVTNFANDLRVDDYATNSGTIGPDSAGAKGALAVAAVAAADPGTNDPEDFSSRGPLRRFFNANGVRLGAPEVRGKPEIAAADRVSTTVPGFATFPGTSAAAPHAAAIAALVKSADPSLTVDEIYARMMTPANVIACTIASDCGSGFLLADRLVVTPTPTPTPVVQSATPQPQPSAPQAVVTPADTKPPSCVASASSLDLAKAVKSGLRISLRCDEAAAAGVELRVDSRTARRLGLGERLGRTSKSVPARATPITVSLSAAAKRRLKTVRSLKVRVLITARDAAGNSARRLTVNVTLKRKR